MATARRKGHLNPRFRHTNCPRTGVLPRRTAAQSLGLAPAMSRLSPQQSPSIFWCAIPTRVHSPDSPLTLSLLARQAHLCMFHARAARGPAAASSESAIGVDLQMSFTMLFAIWSRHGTDGCCQNPHACVFSGRPRGKLPGAIVDCQIEHQCKARLSGQTPY